MGGIQMREEKVLATAKRSGQVVTYCAYCREERVATHVLEVVMSLRPEPGTGGGRGKRQRSVTRRVCQMHAERFLEVAARDTPSRQAAA
jgi:hypothetical protein